MNHEGGGGPGFSCWLLNLEFSCCACSVHVGDNFLTCMQIVVNEFCVLRKIFLRTRGSSLVLRAWLSILEMITS